MGQHRADDSSPARATRSRSRTLSGAVLLLSVALVPEPPASAERTPSLTVSAVRCWIDADTNGAIAALERLPAGRERDLNLAVARLYAGEAAAAEADLAGLWRREPGWTPAVRWLARAQRQLARPEALATAVALLARRDADARDHLWAGGLFLEHGDVEGARASFRRAVRDDDGLELGWLWLAETEARLGHAEAARAAASRATALRSEPAPPVLAPADAPDYAGLVASGGPPLRESLRYRVKYLFLHLATLTLDTGEPVVHRGRPARRVVFIARSNPGIFFFHIDSRFESVIGEDGVALAHRHFSNDSDAGDSAGGWDMEPEAGRCTVRSVGGGLFAYEFLPLPPNAQDGLSVLLLTRWLARRGGSVEVPTAVDATWKATRLRVLGRERIHRRGREVSTVRVQSVGRYRGPGGLSGVVDLWVSDDEYAVPLRGRMKVAVGSVGLELLDETPERRVASETRAR